MIIGSFIHGDIANASPFPEKGIIMPSLTFRSATFAPTVVAGLLGATILASPLTAARADTVSNAVIELAQAAGPQSQAAAGATRTKPETVEQRIANLHTALKITPDEDAKWNDVAQSMRQNAAAMEKLRAEALTKAPQDRTAVEDLHMYQKFAQAHVDGLKNLIGSFTTLYDAMPAAQKKIADEVFRTSGRASTAQHS